LEILPLYCITYADVNNINGGVGIALRSDYPNTNYNYVIGGNLYGGGDTFSIFRGNTLNTNPTQLAHTTLLHFQGTNAGFGIDNAANPLQMASGAYVTAGGVWTNASSRDYKENIKQLNMAAALQALKELQPVTYTYKADKTEKHVGFIAEDVPTLLATKDRKGLSSMDMVAVLTKVVQEQQKTIEDLQVKMTKLEATR